MAAPDLLKAARSLRETIEAEADRVEETLNMTAPIVEGLVDSGLFRLLMPEALGGFESDPSTIIEVCEEISFADGSVGWSYAQNTSCMAYLAYMDPELVEPFARSRAGAGMFAPLSVVIREEGGYRVSGKHQFATGSPHADFIGGAGMELVDGESVMGPNGLPSILAYIVPMEKAVMKGNWDVMGLCGTASFDYEIPEQFVEAGLTHSIFETHPRSGGALYGLGPVPLGTISSCGWAIGVAKRALHEIVDIVTTQARTRMGSDPLKEQQVFQRDLALHTQALNSVRLLAHETYGSAVDAIARGESPETLEQIRRESKAAASYIVQVSREATTFAFQASGSHGLRNPNRLQRCFRDMYVGASHIVFDERNFVESVKERLGIVPLPF
jgi:alkylation response protein AidB-like acyl-CoA dehydrogenase